MTALRLDQTRAASDYSFWERAPQHRKAHVTNFLEALKQCVCQKQVCRRSDSQEKHIRHQTVSQKL